MARLPLLLLGLSTLFSPAAPALAQPPAMGDYWPNADGLHWSFQQHVEQYSPPGTSYDARMRLLFDGTALAPDGIQAQYLRQQPIGPVPPATALELSVRDPLLRMVWVARPDLRVRIMNAMADQPCPQISPEGTVSFLLDGELAYLKTADEIAAWRCNLPNTRSWQWLVADVSIGTTFTLQLIPDLASDVFLHGSVAAIEPADVPAGSFAACLRVDYTVDYGVSTCLNDNGEPQGTFRSETRGFVRYAPGVGPVESREEFVPVAEMTGTCSSLETVGRVTSLIIQRLEDASTPADRMTWGALKIRYR